MNYYRRFPGDYASDTHTLTTRQHGAYTLLLDYQYSTERPILSIRHANQICRAERNNPEGRSDQRAVKFILETYFQFEPDGYWNKRVKEEIKYTSERREKARDAALAGHKRDKFGTKTGQKLDTNGTNTGQQSNINFNGINTEPERTLSNRTAILDSRLQTPLKNNFKTFSPTKPVLGSAEFLVFWEMYPNKVDRLESLKIWIRGMFDGFSIEILAGLEQWKGSEQWSDGERIPYPSTWLNKRRWKETPKQKQTNGSKTDEAIKRYKNRSDSGVAGEIEPALQHGTLRRPN